MPDREKLISANALIEHLDRSIAESKGLIGSACVAIKCYVEQMPAVDMPKWIPVTERLPECDGRYLCNVKSFSFPGTFYRTILQYVDGGFVEGHIYTDDVTHWMPLPEPPKEVE